MINKFEDLISKAKQGYKPIIAVAVAQDEKVLSAIKMAQEIDLASAILVGNKEEIETFASKIEMDLRKTEIVDVKDKTEACFEAIRLVKDGHADIPMKGFVETATILKAVLNKEKGLRTNKLLSHVGVLEVEGFDRLFLLSDSAMNVNPDLTAKVQILKNAIDAALALEIKEPKIALLCATEHVNEIMPATLDAERLTHMNEVEDIFKPAVVKGPLALDNAISLDAAKEKNINHPVAGRANILITPDIEAGNMLNKSMEYFAKATKAGVIMGAKTPIILTSRASSDYSKMNSIALALLILKNMKPEKGKERL